MVTTFIYDIYGAMYLIHSYLPNWLKMIVQRFGIDHVNFSKHILKLLPSDFSKIMTKKVANAWSKFFSINWFYTGVVCLISINYFVTRLSPSKYRYEVNACLRLQRHAKSVVNIELLAIRILQFIKMAEVKESAGVQDFVTITVKWSGNEYVVQDIANNACVGDLKEKIFHLTGVKSERQKLLGLKCKGMFFIIIIFSIFFWFHQ